MLDLNIFPSYYWIVILTHELRFPKAKITLKLKLEFNVCEAYLVGLETSIFD